MMLKMKNIESLSLGCTGLNGSHLVAFISYGFDYIIGTLYQYLECRNLSVLPHFKNTEFRLYCIKTTRNLTDSQLS